MARPWRSYRRDAFGDASGLDLSSIGAALAQSLAKTVEIRTNASPPIVLDVGTMIAPGEPGSSTAMSLLQPTVILDGGSLGRQVVAPYGAAGTSGGGTLLGGLGLVFGLGYFLGKRRGRKGA